MIEKLEGEVLPPPAGAGEGEGRIAEPVGEEPGARFARPAPPADAVPASDAVPPTATAPPIDAIPEPGVSEDEGAGTSLQLDPRELRGALEAVLFAVSEPISIRALAELFQHSVHEIRAAIEELRLEYIDQNRAFRIEDIAGGIQLLTLGRFDPWVRRLRQKEREGKLSAAALETLSVIAYKQPLGKADLEAIRGVGCGPILKTLLERGLIQVVGRSEALGRPILYGTTRRFLESFGIGSVKELPQPELEARTGADRPPSRAPAPPPQVEERVDAPPPPESTTTPSGPELS
jgi:segregation and condensation protein B